MIKNIIKEILIMFLLCIAIALLLGILLYDYIPSNKVIPQKQAYSTPENIKLEINEEITEVDKTEISYEITDSDLNIYKQTSSYIPGKKDPFEYYSTSVDDKGNNNNNNDNSDNSSSENNSTNTFFDDGGIK